MTTMRIILADDSSLILERLQQMIGISKKAQIIGIYNNGTDTLQALKTLKPDVAIVDIKMPGLTGLQVLNEIRKENKSIKFIILTFYSSDHYRNMAFRDGADYYFSKVDDFEKVFQAIEEIAENRNEIQFVNN